MANCSVFQAHREQNSAVRLMLKWLQHLLIATGKLYLLLKPAVERVQALTDILHLALYIFAVYKAISLAYIRVCCHSNKTNAPIAIANPSNSAQLEASPTHSLPPPKLRPGPCSSVGMQQVTDRHTRLHFASTASREM